MTLLERILAYYGIRLPSQAELDTYIDAVAAEALR